MTLAPLQVVTNSLTTYNLTLPSTKRWTTAQIAGAAAAVVAGLVVTATSYQSDGQAKNVFYVSAVGVPSAPAQHLPLRVTYRLMGCE